MLPMRGIFSLPKSSEYFVPQAMAMHPLFSCCCPLYLVFRAEPVAYKAFVDLLLLVTLFVFQRLRPIIGSLQK